MKLASYARPNHIILSQETINKLEVRLKLPEPEILKLENPKKTMVVHQLVGGKDISDIVASLEGFEEESGKIKKPCQDTRIRVPRSFPL